MHCRLDYGLVWRERYADAITDTLGQPLSRVGKYNGEDVDYLSRIELRSNSGLSKRQNTN
ncbi:MAG TPA: hypothetical protein VIX17_28095 [Pyrinomonadaceae bacterium]